MAAPPLPAAALPAWQAYDAMRESKEAHFAALEAQQVRARTGAMPSLAEKARLDGLLVRHDHCVAAFRDAVRELGASDPAAQRTLLAHIAELNRELGGPEGSG